MQISVSNLTSKLETDNPKIIEALHDKYGFKVPGYQYTPQYKRRVWDGRKHYFGKKGEFRSGLLPRILADLSAIGCNNPKIEGDPILVDHNPHSVEDIPGFTYYDYQREAIAYCLENRKTIVESPVGSGKTLIMAGIVHTLRKYYKSRILILFREKGILKQTYDFFKACKIDSLGINSGEGFIAGEVMLSTIQSLVKIIDSINDVEVLMVDEVHQFSKGELTVTAIESFPNAIYRMGFTATVPTEKDDIHGRLTLEGAFGPVFTTRTTEDLIKDGKLAKPLIQIVEYSPPKDPKDDDLPYRELYLKYIVNSELRNSKIFEICDLIRAKNTDSKTLILCKNLEHVKILKATIPNCYTVEGKDELAERYDTIKKFLKDKDHPVLVGTNVLQTGININEITHMINARGLEGGIPTIQGLGRGLRIAEGKDSIHYYDFYDKVPYLEDHSKQRIKHYKNLKLEITYVKF